MDERHESDLVLAEADWRCRRSAYFGHYLGRAIHIRAWLANCPPELLPEHIANRRYHGTRWLAYLRGVMQPGLGFPVLELEQYKGGQDYIITVDGLYGRAYIRPNPRLDFGASAAACSVGYGLERIITVGRASLCD